MPIYRIRLLILRYFGENSHFLPQIIHILAVFETLMIFVANYVSLSICHSQLATLNLSLSTCHSQLVTPNLSLSTCHSSLITIVMDPQPLQKFARNCKIAILKLLSFLILKNLGSILDLTDFWMIFNIFAKLILTHKNFHKVFNTG